MTDSPLSGSSQETEKSNPASLHNNIDDLRNKLKNFSIISNQDQQIGEIKDVVLDTQHGLNLVVALLTAQGEQRFVLLKSKFIETVDAQTRSVFVKNSPGDISGLPDYPFVIGEGRPNVAFSSSTTQRPLEELVEPAQPEAIAPELGFLKSCLIDYPTASKALSEESHDSTGALPHPSAQTEVTIPLMEEEWQVSQKRRKLGEVIVRKMFATRMIEVPIQYEKLLIEQVSPQQKSLVEVDLSQEKSTNRTETTGEAKDSEVRGQFNSPESAIQALDAIAKNLPHSCKRVRVEIEPDIPPFEVSHREFSCIIFSRLAAKEVRY